jgi:hypothetical protein
MMSDLNKKILYICPEAFIGNCLRNISSCAIIAKYYNYNIIIDMLHNGGIWPKESAIITELFRDICRYDCENKYKKMRYRDVGYYSDTFFNGTNHNLIYEGRLKPNMYFNTNEDFGLSSMIYSIIPGDMTKEEFIKEKLLFYNNVNFPSWLLNNVENFNKKYNLASCIGIHIRYTDNMSDTAKNDYNFNTNFDTFLSRINKFENETILICSDNNDILNFFKNYKENTNNTFIFADECEIPEKEKQAFFQPLYEMMLLSNTSKIIGSASSTFSYEAAFFKGTDIELYEREFDITNDTNTLSPNNKFIWKSYNLSQYK